MLTKDAIVASTEYLNIIPGLGICRGGNSLSPRRIRLALDNDRQLPTRFGLFFC